MASRFWGGLVNAVLPGTPYNRHTQTFNPAATRASVISGVVGQVNPIAGKLTELYLGRNPQVQAHEAGLRGWDGMTAEFKANQPNYNPGMQVQGWNMGPMSAPSPLAGMVQQGWQDQAYNNLNTQTNQRLAYNEAAIGNQLSQRLAAAPAASNPRSSMAAGGHTIAEGAAAQQMFGDMRDAAQQSQMDAYQRQWKERYGGHMG